ncbi:hypothetical protein ABZ738_11155 [Micromonospora sp. NPDC047793]|uniref:hypothetical protein n=1 Tax=Micromonospora sp. NPDC047793 TaxID=3154342 RepID=UPI0033F35173
MIAIPFVAMYWIVKAYIKWPAARVGLLAIMGINTVVAVVGTASQDAEMWPAAALFAVISALMGWHVWHTFARHQGNAEGVATIEAPPVPRGLDATLQAQPPASSTQAPAAVEPTRTQRSPEAEAEYQRAAVAFRMLLARRALAGIARPASGTGARLRVPS